MCTDGQTDEHEANSRLDKIPSDHTRPTRMFACVLRSEHKLLRPDAWNCSLLHKFSVEVLCLYLSICIF